MTKPEIAQLLALAAAFDQRTIGRADVEAWSLALGDLGATDASEAVARHYRASRDRVMPADIRQHARAIRRDRDERARTEALVAPVRAHRDPLADPRPLRATIREIIAAHGLPRLPQGTGR